MPQRPLNINFILFKGHILMLLTVFLFFLPLSNFSQDLMPLNHEWWIEKDYQIQLSSPTLFTALKPLPDLLFYRKYSHDTLVLTDTSKSKKSWVYRKLFLEDLVKIHSEDFNLVLTLF